MSRTTENNRKSETVPARTRASVSREADLILHPVRMRILMALASGHEMTASAIESVLADVPHASLYRHLGVMVDGGMLDVVGERRVRGAVERTYAIRTGAGQLGPESVAAMTREDHLRTFTMYLAALLDGYARYVRRDHIDPVADGLSYRAATLHLTDAEHAELLAELTHAIGSRLRHEPRPGRTARTIATILIPGERDGPA